MIRNPALPAVSRNTPASPVAGYINTDKQFETSPEASAAHNAEALQAAVTAALAAEKGIFLPSIGIYKVAATAVLIGLTSQCMPIRGAACGREGGLASALGGTKIRRELGTAHLLNDLGIADEVGARGTLHLQDIALDGGNREGDLVLLSRVNDVCCQNARLDNAQGRLMRCLQAFNSRWSLPYFSNGGTEDRVYTACTWEAGKNTVIVPAELPPDLENLLVYANGFTPPTVVREAIKLKAGEWELRLSTNATEASTATGVLRIEGSPAVSFEGINADGSFGSTDVVHISSPEFEGNRGVDLDLAGSADGQAGPCALVFWEGGKCERQIATNHEPAIRLRNALGIILKPNGINLGGSITTATATIKAGTLKTLELEKENPAVAIGQQVTGLGSPLYVHLRANGVTTSRILKIQGTIPTGGAGAVSNEGTTFSGVAVGMRVRTPGSNAIPAGTTITAILSETELEISAPPGEELAGQRITIGGMWVEAVAGPNVTLDVNALGAHTAQTYVFGGSGSRHVDIPSWGYPLTDAMIDGTRLQQNGAPDIYINHGTGTLNESAITLLSAPPCPPGLAYHRIGKGVALDAFKLPVRAARAQFQRQLISDERTATGTETVSSAYEFRPLPIQGFVVGEANTAPKYAEKGEGLAYYECPKEGNPRSIIKTYLRVPDDLVPNGWLYIAVQFWSTSNAGNVLWILGALTGTTIVNAAKEKYEEQAKEAKPAAAVAGKLQTVILKTKTTIQGDLLVPGMHLYLAITREPANAEDTLNAPANITGLQTHYQHT